MPTVPKAMGPPTPGRVRWKRSTFARIRRGLHDDGGKLSRRRRTDSGSSAQCDLGFFIAPADGGRGLEFQSFGCGGTFALERGEQASTVSAQGLEDGVGFGAMTIGRAGLVREPGTSSSRTTGRRDAQGRGAGLPRSGATGRGQAMHRRFVQQRRAWEMGRSCGPPRCAHSGW